MIELLYIPSPDDGVWNLGPVPIRGYALCIIAGIVAAIWIGERRWVARGGQYGEIQDIAIWAVPFGLVGARLYHVATDWERYFGADSVEGWQGILYVWHGGLGIWGGVALGAFGAYLGARRKGIRFLPLVDTLAPGVLVAQAIGRWGNWFNQELYGRPTDVPWALEVQRFDADGKDVFPDAYKDGFASPAEIPDVATFHPTFLYECLWNLAAFALILWLERRFRLGHGRVMAVYVMAYTAGRGWIEYLRIDDVQLQDVFGLRFNVWTSIVLFVAAAAFFVWSLRTRPGREDSVYRDGRGPADEGDAGSDEAATAPDTAPATDPEADPATHPDEGAAEGADRTAEKGVRAERSTDAPRDASRASTDGSGG